MMEIRETDYREIILHGYNRERNVLKLFFIDESEIWKNEGISKARFFQNLHDAANGMRSILEALIETAMMDIEIYPDAENKTFEFIAGKEIGTLGMADLDLIINAIDDAQILSEHGRPKDAKSNEPLTDFESLFRPKYRDKIPEFMQMLRGGKSALITDRNNDDLPILIGVGNEWIGVYGAARAFCEVLREMGIFVQKARPSSKDVRRIMRDTFKGLPEYYYKEVGAKGGEYREYFQRGVDTIIANK